MKLEDIQYLKQIYNQCNDSPSEYIKHYKYVLAGIPLAYRLFTLESFTTLKISDNIRKIKSYLSLIKKHGISGLNGKGLYFFGQRGSGKTSLMCVLLKEIINSTQYSCKFITFQDLVNVLNYRSSYDNIVENPMELEEEVSFLAIDGFGEDQVQDYNKSKFINLLKKRFFQLKPTLITSVLSPTMISSNEKFGNSVGSLFRETMEFLDYTKISDYRKNK